MVSRYQLFVRQQREGDCLRRTTQWMSVSLNVLFSRCHRCDDFLPQYRCTVSQAMW
ncbi:hypothetical protein Zm00014a_038694 [Zea mays]|uniref:Uncharacterized protein n=1 Tax=Zea mays TaxID=4577 RepID=A0A3L6FGI3_MAIZE|nr:hypothetical protein Zm00014a_038694 [Zea mays]